MALDDYKNNLDKEFLLKLLETTDDSVSVAKSDFTRFIEQYKLQPGDNLVRIVDLYSLYKKTTETPLNYKQFIFYVEKLFKVIQTKTAYRTFINVPINQLIDYEIDLNNTKRAKKNRRVYNLLVKFISAYHIKDGTVFIPAMGLHRLYKFWAIKSNKMNISIKIFKEVMPVFFENTKTTKANGFCVGVDKAFLDNLSPYLKELLKQGSYEKEENQAVERPIPGTEAGTESKD